MTLAGTSLALVPSASAIFSPKGPTSGTALATSRRVLPVHVE